jgi:hypothetical protein
MKRISFHSGDGFVFLNLPLNPHKAAPNSSALASHYVLRQGIIGPLRRLNNTAHNEPHAFAGASGRVVLL